jgi:hypothetical protein
MPSFNNIGDQHETEAPQATIEVELDVENPIPTGARVFSLRVVDEAGNVSDPATVDVIIRDTNNPTAVIRAIPTQVEFGQSFILDGRLSSDVPPGRVVRYIWTRVS